MTNAVQLSGKNNAGNIFVLGGANFDEFHLNVLTAVGGDATLADAIVKDAVAIVLPTAAGAGGQKEPWGHPPVPPRQPDVPPAVAASFPQAQVVSQPPPAAANGQVCPDHGQPLKLVSPREGGKQFTAFQKCAVTDGIVSKFGKTYELLPHCPAAKPRA